MRADAGLDLGVQGPGGGLVLIHRALGDVGVNRVPAASLATGTGALVLYLATAVAVPYWGDSSELALCAKELTPTHPPGYVVYVTIAHLATRLASDPARATTALSMVAAGLTVVLLTRAVGRLRGAIAGVTAGIVFALHPSVWFAATTTEVYALNSLFVLVAIVPLLTHERVSTRHALLACLMFALGLGASPANLLLLPGFLILLYAGRGSTTLRRYGACFLMIGVAVVGFAAWNIARARVLPPLGATTVPDSAGALVTYMTGRDYNLFASPYLAFDLERTAAHALSFARDYAWIFAGLGLFGSLSFVRMSRRRGIGLVPHLPRADRA